MSSRMNFAGVNGSSSSSSSQRNNESSMQLVKQDEASTGASKKQLLDAGQLIERELDHDEKREDLFDELTSHENGSYHFEKNRLQLRRTVPIPQAIIDQYDHLECKSFVGLFPEIHRAYITIDNKLFLWNYYDGSDFYVYDELSQIIISVALLKPKPGVFVESIQYILIVSTPVEILMFALKFDQDNVHNSLTLFPTQFTIPSDNVHMTSIIGTEQGRIFLCGRDGGIYELDYWSNEEGGWFGGGGVKSGSVGGSVASAGLAAPFTQFFLSHRKKCRKLNHSTSSFRLIRSILPTFLGGLNLTSGEQCVESIVYDSTRNFLYTLCNEPVRAGTTKPVVSVYELGVDGWQMRLRSRNDEVWSNTREALRQVSADLCADLATASEFKLVHLSCIPVHESATILLMALTSHGHRLYFHFDSRTDRLRVKFVRLCPPAIAPDELHRGPSVSSGGSLASRTTKVEPRYAKGTSPSLVHTAYYKDGILLLADAGRSALGDSLVSIHKDPRPIAAQSASNYNARSWAQIQSSSYAAVLNETIDSFDFESRIADLSEVHQSASLNLLSSALYARQSNYASKYTTVTAASSFASSSHSSSSSRLNQPLKPLYGLPELATQHLTPNRQLLVLTSSSLLTLIKLRPLDELKHALSVKKRTNDETSLIQFASKYGIKESCAMCLILIGANFVAGTHTNSSAILGADGSEFDSVEHKSPVRASSSSQQPQSAQQANGTLLNISSPNKLLGLGASPHNLGLGGVSDEQLRKGAKQAFFRFGELAQELRGGAVATSSPKIEGIALCLSRWLRSHWDWSLCITQIDTTSGSISSANNNLPVLSFRFSKAFYRELLHPLIKLQRFMEEHQRLLVRDVPVGASSASAVYGAHSGIADPSRIEYDNFQALSALLNLTIEVFNLLLLFLTYAPPAASAASYAAALQPTSSPASVLLRSSPFLSSNDLQSLIDMKFADVITSSEGHALVRKMINTLAQVGASSVGLHATDSDHSMNGRSKRSRDADETSSNQLISQLHHACPTFFGSSELLYYNALDSLKQAKQHWNLATDRANHITRALQTYHSFLASPTFPLEDVADKLKGVYEYAGIVELAMRRAELLERREVPKPKQGGSGMTSSQGAHLPDAEYYAYQRQRCFHVLLDTMNILMFGVIAGKSISTNGTSANGTSSASSALSLDSMIPPLSSDQLSAIRDRVVSQILSSHDVQLHHAFYSWYIEKGLLDELYTIQSEHLIRFLTASEEYVLILKDYYLRNERWHEASLLLNYLSLKKGTEYTLMHRIDFLTRALHCARNYQIQLQKHGVGTSPAIRGVGAAGRSRINGAAMMTQNSSSIAEQQDLIDQLKDRIEIAKIQSDIYSKLQLRLDQSYSDSEQQRLESRSSATRESDVKAFLEKKEQHLLALSELDSSLLDLQQLYLFCTNFGLWESCLSIFSFSNESQRTDVIRALWKNIFRQTMSECKRAGQDWGDRVEEKFIELASGKQTNYRDIDYMFPLDFIIRELEINNFKYRAEPSETWVAETLLKSGVSSNRLLQQYDRLLEEWDEHADEEGVNHPNAKGQTIQTFLYESIFQILRYVVEQERSSSSSAAAGRRAHTTTSTSSTSAAAMNLLNKCLTNLRTLPPSSATTRIANQFQQLAQAIKQR